MFCSIFDPDAGGAARCASCIGLKYIFVKPHIFTLFQGILTSLFHHGTGFRQLG